MTVDDVESELYERVQRDDLEEVVRDLAEALNTLAHRCVHVIGGDAVADITELTHKAVEKVSAR